MASTATDKNFKKMKNGARMFATEAEDQQYYRWARSWRRKKSARRSRIPSPPPPPSPSPSPSSPSEETIYLNPSRPGPRRPKTAVRSKPPDQPEDMIKVAWPRKLKVAVRSKIPEEEEAAAEYSSPSSSPATTRASRCSIPLSSVGDNFSPPPPSHRSPSPSSPSSSSGSVTSPFLWCDCLRGRSIL